MLAHSFASASVALVGTLSILALVMIYPRVWWETLSTALILGLILMFLPLIETLPDFAPAQNQSMVVAWILFGTVFGSIFLWLGLNWLPDTVREIPYGLAQWTSRICYDMPADKAFQILKTTPDSDDGYYKVGPAGVDGVFSVSMTTNTVNPQTYEPEIEELHYKCRIEQEGEYSQIISVFFMVEDEANVDVERLSIQANGSAAICETRTVRSRRSYYEDLGFWLQDYGGDHLYGRLARTDGQGAAALNTLPYVSPLVGLARFFERFNDNPPNPSDGST
ncbi:hypothetical protein [Ruegeria meonggei]|uniref:hypothetical protein n=1 Tax=Ruegeria meonggei TaxID=1446476 RepID=UPI00367214B3